MATNYDATTFVKSKYLKGSDLDKRKPIRVTVENVDQREFPEQGEKLVLKFLEVDQEMILNKTQIGTMIELFGAQTGTWRGQRLNLMQVASSYQGKPTILITEAEQATPGSKALAPETGDILFGDER
jgi:hypothetical protein